jgi:hypothetical protein
MSGYCESCGETICICKNTDWEAEAADARMDAIILLEHLKVAIEHLERERRNYRLTPVYLESAIQNLKQTARDFDFKLKGANS